MLRKGPTSLLEVGPFVYSLSRPGWDGFQLPDYRKIFILPSSESVPR